jgi:nicotinate-nucleotide adenylyltransferase
MRVGWFGGSFDPPHRGHVTVARAAADAYGLERVLMAPVGRQPLKGAGTGYAERLAMVGLACAGDPRLVASDVDAPRGDGGPNYTVDTLERLRSEMAGVELYGIVGMDAFREMGKWREPARLVELAEWIVVTRPGYGQEVRAGAGRVHLLETVHVDVSATALRERLRRGEDCAGLVPEAVLAYIAEHGLYRE